MILRFFNYLKKRENITALAMIIGISGISLVLALAAAGFSRYKTFQNQKVAKQQKFSAYQDELRKLSGITTNLEQVPDITAKWKKYSGGRYNFSIKYPDRWVDPTVSLPIPGQGFLQKISFGAEREGFDIYVYDAKKFPNPLGTDNLVKKIKDADMSDCPRFDDIVLGEAGYPAKEVNVLTADPCYKETFFYSLTAKGHTYNIVPRLNGSSFDVLGRKINLLKNFPVFYDIVSTLDFPENTSLALLPQQFAQKVVRPPVVKYTAGMRCPKKNDHPSYSQTKGKHMDEDCCPDPDEWPNPACAYSASQLGVMKAKPKK